MTRSADVAGPTPRVAIIGAGLSGLACASSLEERGFDVRLLDKGRSPGGRASTRRAEIAGVEVGFDHGAQYFTVRDRELSARVSRWKNAGAVREWDGRIVAIGEDGSIRQSRPELRYVGTPAMSSICKHLAEGLDVRRGVTVGRIEALARGVELFDRVETSLGAFDFLVCTAPPAQSAALLAEPAPDLAARAVSVEMKPCWAVMAAFESPLEAPFDGAFVNLGPLSWVARASSKPGRRKSPDRWVLHANPDWSTEHLEDSAERTAQSLLDAFYETTSLVPRAPIYLRAHRWRYALAHDPLDVGCLWDANLGVALCGDWAYGNRIEGAFLSGLAAAERITEIWSAA